MSPPQSSQQSISALTGLRGYAALWVVLSHLSFTDSLSSAVADRLQWKLANGVLRHEYLAVDLFFMLSGFVLTHAHGREIRESVDRRSYGRFLLLRLARVYPLHFVALVGMLVIRIVDPGISPWSSPGSFVLHIFMIASWGFMKGPTWNGPAWSLSSEWMAYLVLPLILLCTGALVRLRTQLIVVGLILGAFTLIFFSYVFFGSFQFDTEYANGAGAAGRVLTGVLLGSVLRRLYDQPAVRRLPWTALFWISIPVAIAFMTGRDGHRLDNNPWAYFAIMFMTFAAACAPARRLLPLTVRPAVYLGEISYAIYIFHYPTLLVLRLLAGGRIDEVAHRASPLPAQLLALGACVVVLGVAAIAHHVVEEPLRRRARRWIDQRYPLRPGASS
jgi:peptidoglycan/LPS O-acetylase OafA/YrhL